MIIVYLLDSLMISGLVLILSGLMISGLIFILLSGLMISELIFILSGLMISGLAKAGATLSDRSFVDIAEKAASFVQKYLYRSDSNTLLRSCYTESGHDIVQGYVQLPFYRNNHIGLILISCIIALK